jgi:hypothetical protein
MKVLEEVPDIKYQPSIDKKHRIPGLGWYVHQSSTPQQPTLLQTRLPVLAWCQVGLGFRD